MERIEFENLDLGDVASIVNAAVTPLREQIVDLTDRLELVEAALIPPTPPPVTNPSGEAPPVGNLPGWRQIFLDDLTVDVPLGQFPTATSKWVAYPTNYRDTSKIGVYDAGKTISVADSMMKIRLHTDGGGVVRVAAPVPLIRPRTSGVLWPGQLYGRYAVRARFATLAPGFKVAWLLWPDSGTNTTGSPDGVGGNGEIDAPEHGLGQRTSTSAFMHRQNAIVGNDQYQAVVSTNLDGWHTFVTEWSPNLCRFLLDGIEYGRTSERVPKTSMHWVLQSECRLSGGIPPAGDVAEIFIDWAAVWAHDPAIT